MKNIKTNLPLNIALLLGDLDETYHNLVWPNFIKVTKELNINLFLIVGRQLDTPFYDGKDQNIIYNLISNKRFDGLILFSGSLGHFIDYKILEKYIKYFKDIPMVGIDQKLEGIPTIQINNRKGEEELIKHLLEKHNYKKFAFIQGPKGHLSAKIRFDVFRETLNKYNIIIDQDLISSPGNFLMDSGRIAVSIFLKTGKKIDVIVCANDEMAIGAIKELKRNGFEVPFDIAVVGFDNTDEACFFHPPLTTVKQPFFELSKIAVNLLINIINGKKNIESIEIDTKVEIKHSCGCDLPIINEIENMQNDINKINSEKYNILNKFKDNISKDTIIEMNISDFFQPSITIWFEKIINQIIIFRGNKKNLFYSLIKYPRNMIYDFNDYNYLKEILSCFFNNCLKYIKKIEDKVFLQDLNRIGNILIEKNMFQDKALENINFRKSIRKIQQANQHIVTSFDINILIKRFVKDLIKFDINSCYIVLYNGIVEKKKKYVWKIPKTSKLILAVNSGKILDLNKNEAIFNTYELLPPKIFSKINKLNIIVMPLLYKEEQFGFILIELGSMKNLIYETFRAQISSVLKKEKDYQEDKYSALGMLFSGISHEILNPLGGVFAPLENMKVYLEKNNIKNIHPKLNSYIDRMEQNLTRIEDIIKGLRAIYYDRNLIKSNYSLKEIILSALENIKKHLSNNIQLKIDIPDSIIISVNFQAIQIIIQNILKNSIDAINSNGIINIKYHEKNNIKLLKIIDNGKGIKKNEINNIFDAFYTTKDVGKGTGLGLFLVKDLAQRLNWNITVNSKINKGTEFILQINT